MTFSVTGTVLTQVNDDGNTTATDLTTRGLDGLFGTAFQNTTQSFTATAGQTEFTVVGTRASGVTVAGVAVPFTQRIIANGLRIEIAAASAGQDVIVTFNVVDRHFDGNVAVYTLAPGLRFDVTGTLTINPEIERLIIDDPVGLQVTSAGRLNLGKELTKGGFTRNSKGVAVYFSNAPAVWFGLGGGGPGSTNASRLGLGTNFRVLSGGELFWRGAEIRGTVSMGCIDGSSVRIIDGTMTVFDAPAGTTDPRTGNNVTTGNGLFENGGSIPAVSRGFITWFNTADIAIDGFTVCNGGEIAFVLTPTGTNTLDTTAQNGIRGYSPVNTAIGTFPNRTDLQTFSDSSIGGNGNLIDVTIQSERNIEDGGGQRTVPTVTTLTNERAGTNLIIDGGEGGTAVQPRNYGTVLVTRNFNIAASSLANSAAEINGGRYYIKDTDNGFRTNINGRDDTEDYTYSGFLTNNVVATDANILLGAVKLPSSPPSRRSQFTPANLPTAGNIYAIDLRGKAVAPATAAVIGGDIFDAHYWHTDYQYFVQEIDLSDGTVGTFEMTANLATDLNYQIADFAVAGEISTLDELYKAEKMRKVATATDVAEPSIGSLYTVASDSNIDIGALPLTINQTATERYEATHSGMTAGAIMTASFNTGGVTRVGGSNATLTNEANDATGDGEVGLATSFASLSTYRFLLNTGNDWSRLAGVYLDVDSPGASGIANTTNPILLYVDSNNYALFVPGVGTAGNGTIISRQLGAIALNSDGDMIMAGSPPGDGVEVTVIYGPQAMLYQEGMTIPAGLEIGSTALSAGSVFTGLVTTNIVNQGGLAVDYDLTAGTITGLPTSGEIITENGAITGGVALAAGTYLINGDASGAVFTRSGSTGTVTLTFGTSAVRPASITDPNVEAPFALTINSRTDTNGRLSVYRNNSLINASDTNPATYNTTGTSAGTDNFVIVYTAPGRRDFRMPISNLSADMDVDVITESNPFPPLPIGSNAIPRDDVVGRNVATFTAGTTPGTGIITILDGREWNGSATVTNYGVQNLTKGSEVYNNMIRVSGETDIVESAGVNSFSQVNSTLIQFVSPSPQTVGYVEPVPAMSSLATSVTGRFFTPNLTASRGTAGVWNYDRTGANAPVGTFTYNASLNVINIARVDADGVNRRSYLLSTNIRNGDYMLIRNDDTNMTLFTQAVVASDTDDDTNVQHRFVFNDTLANVAQLAHGNRYSIHFFDSTSSTIPVGVTFGELDAFDPGVTASQISGAVTDITADIGTTVDAELRRGAITNVGRPPLA